MKPGLERGILRVKSGVSKGVERAYVIKALGKSDLPEIMALQAVIVRHLHCSSLLEPFSSEFMREHLGRRGFVLGVLSDGKLVGFRNVYFPFAEDAEWNLGRDIGLAEDQLGNVANLQMVCVHPDYRGNGLALKLNRFALRILRERNSHDHICATVSPLNIWNLTILLASGFHIRCLKMKYGGKLRYIVYQRLKTPVRFHTAPVVKVTLNALDRQQQLLDAGYYAVEMVPMLHFGDQNGSKVCRWEVIFRQPVIESRVHVVPRRSFVFTTSGYGRPCDDAVDKAHASLQGDETDGDDQP